MKAFEVTIMGLEVGGRGSDGKSGGCDGFCSEMVGSRRKGQ